MKKLIAALALCAFLMTVGIGCGGPTSPAKPTTPPPGEKEPKKTTP